MATTIAEMNLLRELVVTARTAGNTLRPSGRVELPSYPPSVVVIPIGATSGDREATMKQTIDPRNVLDSAWLVRL